MLDVIFLLLVCSLLRQPLEDVVYETNIGGAYMVPMGKKVSNSLSLLNTKRLGLLLDRLAESFDMVLIDTSPVGIIVDAAEIAKYCDGALLIASYNNVTRGEMREARLLLERAGCEVLGAVLNKVTFNTLSSKKYYNYKYNSREYYKSTRGRTQVTKGKSDNEAIAK